MGFKLMAVGSITATTLGVASSVSEHTLVPLGLVSGGVVLTGVLSWRLGSRIARIEQKLESLEERFDREG